MRYAIATMDPISSIAASGLRARLDSLDLLANNIANTGTQGYKADREFYNLYVGQDASDPSTGLPARSPVIEKAWVDFSQGTLQVTGNPLDVALSGRGFFEVEGPAGPLYTRSGSFKISTKGVLVGPEDRAVRNTEGRPIQLDPGKPVDISRDGTVTQQGQVRGRIAVMDFADSAVLQKQGKMYFRIGDSAVKPTKASGSTEVLQGKIEGSNVAASEAAVRLVTVVRHFEMLQKAISIAGEMNKRALEEVARVTP